MIAWPALLLAFELLLFAVASLIHAGILLGGYEHARASTAEGVIATVLALGLIASFIWPARLRASALAAQAFALLGTLVGAFTIYIGVGPQTTGDFIFHLLLLAILVSGLVAVVRWR